MSLARGSLRPASGGEFAPAIIVFRFRKAAATPQTGIAADIPRHRSLHAPRKAAACRRRLIPETGTTPAAAPVPSARFTPQQAANAPHDQASTRFDPSLSRRYPPCSTLGIHPLHNRFTPALKSVMSAEPHPAPQAAGRFRSSPFSTAIRSRSVSFRCPRKSESRRFASSAFNSAPIRIASAVR
jgi:hypothetical protein